MKKLIVALVLMFAFVGCGESGDNTSIVYPQDNKDSWTEDYSLDLWHVNGNGSDAVASTVHVAGNYSISTSRTSSGWVSMVINLPYLLALDSLTGVIRYQIYAEDNNEHINAMRVLAPNWNNRFEYYYRLPLNNAIWTQVGFNLSDFTVAAGSPNWDAVGTVVIVFGGGVIGNIKIDEFYFGLLNSGNGNGRG